MSILNQSSGATSYQWDFCSGDLVSTPGGAAIGPIAGADGSFGLDIAFDGTNYFAFLTSRNNNALYRADFGDKLSNTPVIQKLAINTTLFNGPDGIQLYREGSNWYALVSNVNNSTLLRCRLGASLTNVPTTADVVQLTVPADLLSVPRYMAIAKDQDQVFVLVANTGNSQVSVLRFGNSITTNTVTGSNINISGGGQLVGVSLLKDCNQWYGFCTGFGSGTVHRIDFGSSLSATPQSVKTIATVPFASVVKVEQERGQYHGFVSTRSGELLFRGHVQPYLAT